MFIILKYIVYIEVMIKNFPLEQKCYKMKHLLRKYVQ